MKKTLATLAITALCTWSAVSADYQYWAAPSRMITTTGGAAPTNNAVCFIPAGSKVTHLLATADYPNGYVATLLAPTNVYFCTNGTANNAGSNSFRALLTSFAVGDHVCIGNIFTNDWSPANPAQYAYGIVSDVTTEVAVRITNYFLPNTTAQAVSKIPFKTTNGTPVWKLSPMMIFTEAVNVETSITGDPVWVATGNGPSVLTVRAMASGDNSTNIIATAAGRY